MSDPVPQTVEEILEFLLRNQATTQQQMQAQMDASIVQWKTMMTSKPRRIDSPKLVGSINDDLELFFFQGSNSTPTTTRLSVTCSDVKFRGLLAYVPGLTLPTAFADLGVDRSYCFGLSCDSQDSLKRELELGTHLRNRLTRLTGRTDNSHTRTQCGCSSTVLNFLDFLGTLAPIDIISALSKAARQDDTDRILETLIHKGFFLLNDTDRIATTSCLRDDYTDRTRHGLDFLQCQSQCRGSLLPDWTFSMPADFP